MKREEYITQKQNLIDYSLQGHSIIQDDKLNRTLNFVSANFVNFIPSLHINEHESAFKKILLHRTLSALDEQYLEVLDSNVRVEGMDEEYLELLRKKPSIICTFHMGSSRLLNHYLMKKKINFTLVVSDNVIKSNGSIFNRMYEGYKQKLGFKDDKLTIISANEPNAALKMLRELKNGKNLLVYIDGNMGSGNKNIKNENSCEIDFLEESIYARAGVAYLSYLAQVPIIEAVSYRRNWEDIVLKFNKMIEPNKNVDRETYFKTTTEGIYKRFSEVLLKHPEQWEGWLNLHEVINPKEFKKMEKMGQNCDVMGDSKLCLNKRNYGVFNIDSDCFLFDKKKYVSYKIPEPIYTKLLHSDAQPVEKTTYESDSFFTQLIANGVLSNA